MLTRVLFLTLLAVSPLQAEGQLKIVTTTPEFAEIAKRVGNDQVKVESLAKGYQNPHLVDAKPSLIVKLIKADMFIQTGLDLEIGWASILLNSARNKKILPGSTGFVDASDAIEAIEIPVNPTRAMGDVHPGGNPHYMMAPENAILVAELIQKRLSQIRPEGKETFEKGYAEFKQEITEKIKEWDQLAKPLKGATFVSYHKTWSYFADRFGLVSLGEIEPKPGIPPTGSHTNELIKRMNQEKVKLILMSPWFEKRTPRFIQEKTAATVVELALFPEAKPEVKSYSQSLDYNIRSILNILDPS